MNQPDQAPDESDGSGTRRRLHLREVSLAGSDVSENYDGVGAVLAAARVALGVDLDRAALELRIRRTYIDAIESGRFDALPGQAYTQGFVRSYANYLKLDSEDVLERLREETRARRGSTELVFPTPMAETRLPGLRVLAVSLLIAGVVYVGWSMSNWEPAVLERVPPVPDQLLTKRDIPTDPAKLERAVPAVPPVVTAPPVPSPTVTTPAVTSPAPAVPAPSTTAAAPAQSSPTPVGPAYLNILPPPSSAVIATMPALPTLPKLTAANAPVADAKPSGDGAKTNVYGAQEPGRIVIKATADSWVRVDEPGGNVVLRRVLRAGDTYNVPDRSDLIMSAGSAGALDVLVDGEKAPSLGATGEMRQRVPLEADALKRGIPKATKPGKAGAAKKNATPAEGEATPKDSAKEPTAEGNATQPAPTQSAPSPAAPEQEPAKTPAPRP